MVIQSVGHGNGRRRPRRIHPQDLGGYEKSVEPVGYGENTQRRENEHGGSHQSGEKSVVRHSIRIPQEEHAGNGNPLDRLPHHCTLCKFNLHLAGISQVQYIELQILG
ncbi:MAG: hypothetical protein PHG29_13695 [Prolixibacteraceae bacterium]|nr:hypothetical protein [Prolixibacteraceae bacterium]